MFRPTPIDQLRLPHPDQDRVDAEAARLLRSTARPPAGPLPTRQITGAIPRPIEKSIAP